MCAGEQDGGATRRGNLEMDINCTVAEGWSRVGK